VPNKSYTIAAVGIAVGILAAACSSSSKASSSNTTAVSPTTAAGSTGSSASTTSVSLAGVCPSTIVVQTDWNPEADHFSYYELAAPDGTVDTNKKTYTAELLAHGGQDTGVKIQIRSGGPAVGSQLDSALMYEDQSILLGFVQTDEAIELSQSQPTVAIVSTRLQAPTIVMWDPAAHPNDKTIADLGKDGTKVLYFNGAPYMDYLTGAGILKKSQIDGSYNGTPARFVASGGTVAQQGFATAEPYEYQHEITQWLKPVTYQLVSATGYDPYPAIATRPDNVTKYAACFKKLVPIIQQGIVDYAANPAAADALIVKLVTQYNNGWVYSAGEAAFAAQSQVSNGIIANSPGGELGDFDFSRIQKLMGIVEPIYTAEGKTIKSGLTPQDVATNQFIDPSIHLPS
jgi:hypothetical protein